MIRVLAVLTILGSLLPAQLEGADAVTLSEFMASNTRTLAREKNLFEDWIELRNSGGEAVNLEGWRLTTDPSHLRGWKLPALTLSAGAHLVIWASGKDRRDTNSSLHTNFRLGSAGEYLALLRSEGSVATEFAPKYPPQSPDVSYGFLPGITQAVFFASPTPGKANESTLQYPGPRILSVFHSPQLPKPGESVTITARAAPLSSEITNMTLHWRASFHHETNTIMAESGVGVWTAVLPGEAAQKGEFLRWRVTATDKGSHASQLPVFGNTTLSSRYFGVVIPGNSITSALPIFELFLPSQQLRRANSEQGARGCFNYSGEFYDNVFVKVRGNSTAGFPKKSHRIEFPHDHPFRHPGPGGRVKHTSLMAEFGDPTYLRQHLSFWMQEQAGSAAPFHYPVRVQLNGEFWQLAMHSEVLGEELLTRHHLDGNGALYKAVGTVTPDFSSTGGFEKKTRKQEGPEDYLELAHALNQSGRQKERRAALFGMMNVPAVINYLAMARLTQEDDDIWANMSLYHDNDGTGEWRPVPFDMNVSWGFSFGSGQVQARNDRFRSHPFFGASNVGESQGVNQVYDSVVEVPETRSMLLRRMRTLLDRYWQPPGTPLAERVIEQHIAALTNQLWAEAVLDRAKWGGTWTTPQNAAPEEMLSVGVRELLKKFVEPRRVHFYITHSVTNSARPIGITDADNVGVPTAQPSGAKLVMSEIIRSPGRPAESAVTLQNPNAFAVDISSWRLTGRVKFTFEPGTVIPPGATLQVCADLKAWRSSPAHKTEFVVGNFRGSLEEKEKLSLKNDRDKTVALGDQ